jgi:hypothetical protein
VLRRLRRRVDIDDCVAAGIEERATALARATSTSISFIIGRRSTERM